MTEIPKTYKDFGIYLKDEYGTGNVETSCPQCSKTRRNKSAKCLSVHLEKQVWNCHHCGWTGCLKTGRTTRHDVGYTPAPREVHHAPAKGMTENVRRILEKRHISIDVAERYQVEECAIYWPQLEDKAPAVRFPFFENGTVVNYKYRGKEPETRKKMFRQEGGAKKIFYGVDDIDECTVIVEGEYDKLALATAGIFNCVSVPDGAPPPDSKNYENKFEFLDNCKEAMAKCKQWVIAVDSDAPGRRLEEELLARLGRDNCLLVRWPADCKDANDTLIKHGADKLMTLVYNADPPPVPGIVRVRDVMDKLNHLYDHNMRPGVSLSWCNIDRLYKVSPGEWTLVTGIPGHGKSEFLDATLVDLAINHNYRFAVYSPENLPIEQHISKLIEKKSGCPFRAIGQENGWTRISRDQVHETASWVDYHFQFLHNEDDIMTLDTILETTKHLIARDGINGLVIDPWNEINHKIPHHQHETDYISDQLSKIRRFVVANQIHIWVVAHPKKLQKDKDNVYPVPTAYDVAGSSHWYNKPYNIMSIWRNVTKPHLPVEVHIQKIKFKKNGKVGVAHLRYDKVSGRFFDAPQVQTEREESYDNQQKFKV